MNEPIFKVYITKYALTSGIFECEVKQCLNSVPNGSMVAELRPAGMLVVCYHGEGRDWHRTKESALEKAEEMRASKIASVKKALAKLERLKFE